MIDDIRDINKLLIGIVEISYKDDGADMYDVIEECKSVAMGGHLPNYEEIIKFCILCKIIEKKDDFIKLSQLGKNLLRLNDEKKYELNSEQNELLIINCFLNGYFKEETKTIFQQFYADNRRLTFIFSYKSEIPLYGNQKIISVLKQIDLIQEQNNLLLVNPDYAENVSLLLRPKRKMTYDELERKLKIDKITGKIAEKIILEYEKDRLRNDENARPESDLIQIISATFANAGYDIESFDGKTTDLLFNRFIEVKGSTGKKLSFFWSADEIEIARERKTQYWIYFVPQIDLKTQTFKGEIQKIPNPVDEILDKGNYDHECVKIHVTRSL